MSSPPGPRRHMLLESTYRQLLDHRPNVAILPWGATEAHNYHLPHGTDVIEAMGVAERAAELAIARGARPIVLPAIPFGNNAQQLDQVATIHFSTATTLAVLGDVVRSLVRQGIDRLVIVNAHGGNDFKPMVRDLALESGALLIVIDFWRIEPDAPARIFAEPGDHAGELETSLVMHLRPDLVTPETAGPGAMVPWELPSLRQPGVWTPRPWSRVHPDTGNGNPAQATAEKGRAYLEIVTQAIATVIVEVSAARKGQLPYV